MYKRQGEDHAHHPRVAQNKAADAEEGHGVGHKGDGDLQHLKDVFQGIGAKAPLGEGVLFQQEVAQGHPHEDADDGDDDADEDDGQVQGEADPQHRQADGADDRGVEDKAGHPVLGEEGLAVDVYKRQARG